MILILVYLLDLWQHSFWTLPSSVPQEHKKNTYLKNCTFRSPGKTVGRHLLSWACYAELNKLLVNDQRDAQFFSMYLSLFLTLNVSNTSCSSSGETNCVNTTSGSCRSVSVAVSSDTICLSWWWAQCARNMQRVKNKDKHAEKNCVSRWSFTKNRYMMHGQQNITTKI